MTTRATQRRRYRRLSRWELCPFANRRHRRTVSAIPACEINKSSALAERNSVMTRGYLLLLTKRTDCSQFSDDGRTSRC
jgi:hypothetical protein